MALYLAKSIFGFSFLFTAVDFLFLFFLSVLLGGPKGLFGFFRKMALVALSCL